MALILAACVCVVGLASPANVAPNGLHVLFNPIEDLRAGYAATLLVKPKDSPYEFKPDSVTKKEISSLKNWWPHRQKHFVVLTQSAVMFLKK